MQEFGAAVRSGTGDKAGDSRLGLGAAAAARDAGKLAHSLKVGIRRALAADMPQLHHPCLQAGYSQPYARLALATATEPAIVQLVGE